MKVSIADLRKMASEVVDGASIIDVRLLSANCLSTNPVLSGPFNVDSEIQVKGEAQEDPSRFGVFVRYTLWATPDTDSDDDADGELEAWRIFVEQVALYSKPPDLTYSEDQLTAFAMMVGIMVIHPFARETVQSLVSRMGYPPFTMDLIQSLAGLPLDDEVELQGTE